MEVEVAQRTPVVPLPGLLSAAEIATVHEVAQSCAGTAGRDLLKVDGTWDTQYLHTADTFALAAPQLLGAAGALFKGAKREREASPEQFALGYLLLGLWLGSIKGALFVFPLHMCNVLVRWRSGSPIAPLAVAPLLALVVLIAFAGV